MTRLRMLVSRIFMFLRHREIESELDEEIRNHLEMHEDHLRHAGFSAEEARRAALRDFGGVDRAKERYRDRYRFSTLEGLVKDWGHALKMFRKSPGIAATATVTLALGIGASTAIFSIVEATLLRPLPYKTPDRLAAIWITNEHEPNGGKMFASYADYAEFRNRATMFEDISAATWAKNPSRVLTGFGSPREVMTIPASVSFFDTLGVHAALGRVFQPEDEKRDCSLVLSHKFWTGVFNSDPSVVGATVTLDQKSCDVLGVMPEAFTFYPRQSEAWALIRPDETNHGLMSVGIFARLKPGVTLAQAQAEIRAFYKPLHQSESDRRNFQPSVFDLHDEFTFLASRTLRRTLILVFVSVLFVLLIASLNVANLLLSRLSDREREMAVRAALGSPRGRLIRQALIESLLLSGMGTILGMALAFSAVEFFRRSSPIELTVGADVRIDIAVLAFGAALAFATTLISGLLPALRASNVDVMQTLKASGRGIFRSRHRVASTVIAVEIAMTFALLVGAGLLISSALRMGSEPLGFNPQSLATVRISLPAARYATAAERLAFFTKLLGRLKQSLGDAGVALSSKVPPEAGGNQTLEIEGRPEVGNAAIHDVGGDAVSSEFFDVLNIPLRDGRSFDSQDRENSQPVAIVNEALVREYFPNSNPIGQRIRIPGGPMPWLTVVGIVGNLKHTELMNEMRWVETPILYRPFVQEPRPTMSVALRVTRDSTNLTQRIRSEIEGLDPSLPVGEIETLTSRVSNTLTYARFRAVVLSGFAMTALFLSAVGLHGVLSHFIGQRITEFGVRRAVGAQTSDLLLLVAKHGGTAVLAGLVLGLGVSVALSRVLSGLLYGIQSADPEVVIAVSGTLLTTAAIAILLPARRAARIDPIVALRNE